MHLQYVRFDMLVHHTNLDKLKKFTNLRKLYISHNFLNSYILLSKIECIQSLRCLVIENNEILSAKTLKSFIVYRFQHISNFNGLEINDLDKKIAKQQYQLFDKILSLTNIFSKKPIPGNDPSKRQEFRVRAKKNAEVSSFSPELFSSPTNTRGNSSTM